MINWLYQHVGGGKATSRARAMVVMIAVALIMLSSKGMAMEMDSENGNGGGGEQYLTGETGHRVGTNQFSQTATKSGPILLQDIYTLEKLRRFNTERIPERVVHARGAGAHGVFTSSVDLSRLTAAQFLSAPGLQTEIFVRFSTVIHGKHSPETLRDPRGFAIKFKTLHDGNWDLVGNNLPVFFIRDHIKFPDMVHSLKPDPVTNVQDPNRFFDFFAALGGMATHMLTYLYSDLGIPKGYRFMQGNSVHAYKLVNASGHVTYCKFRWFPAQGVKNLTREDVKRVQGEDFNHATKDLYEAIKNGDFPRWSLRVQTMPTSVMDKLPFDPLDATKEWPEPDFPFFEIGNFVLNRVPDNFHLASEQSAFDPGNFLPGRIEPSEDRLLQGRLISYHESQTHRHGSNVFQQLPVNKPVAPVRTYNQDGVMVYEHAWNGSVNYQPSLRYASSAYKEDASYLYSTKRVCGQYTQQSISRTLNFAQAGSRYWRFSPVDRTRLLGNLAADLDVVTSMDVKNVMCAHFYKAAVEFGTRLAKLVRADMMEVRRIASTLQD